jgi:hypothetical protein
MAVVSIQHRSRNAIRIAMVCSILVAATAAAEVDADRPSSEEVIRREARWIPGLSVQTGFLAEQRNGYVDSIERGAQVGDSTALFGLFGASVDLASPEIPGMPISTRFFARADVSVSFDEKESLASEGDPGDPIRDPDANLEGGPVGGILGTGTTLRVQAEPLILSAGMGLTFTTEIAERAVRIKPSLEWQYQRDEIYLRFADIESEGPNPEQCGPCRATAFQSQTTKGFHSLGPGVEIDVDSGRIGDFRISVFSQFRALGIVGDREAYLDATGAWYTRTVERINGQNVVTSIEPADGRADTTVVSRYRREPWSFFAAAGVRIVWEPE